MGVVDEPDVDDVEIALRLMERDEEGLRLLLEAHGGRVRGVLRKRYNGTLSDTEIEDAFSSALMKVWRFADRYDDGKGSLRAWFLQIAINCVKDQLRANKRKPELHVGLDFDPPTIDGDNAPPSIAPKLRADLHEVIQELPEKQKLIILADLAAVTDPDEPEDVATAARLAARIGSTKGSVYVSRNKAKEKIRTELIKRGHYNESEEST